MNQKSTSGDPKTTIYKVTATELKEIVLLLNKPPFDENFTMVSFDELQNRSLVALLEKVLKMINEESEFSLSDKTEENKALFGDLLSILSFPEATDDRFLEACMAGEKTSVHRLLYYLLKGFNDFKQRAYLGKFLAPLDVPGEFLVDEEMRKLDQEFKELQKVFQSEHQELSSLRTMIPNKKKFDQEVTQLEAERDQLKVRISMFQQKSDTKDPAASALLKELLAGTRALRKEQEEENMLTDKLRSQREALDHAAQSFLIAQQKYSDTQRDFGQEVRLSDFSARDDVKFEAELRGVSEAHIRL